MLHQVLHFFHGERRRKSRAGIQNGVVFQSSEEGPHPGQRALCGHPASNAGPGRRSGQRRLQEAARQEPVPSIILARGGRYWVYAYLFAKQDRANIKDNELVKLRALASLYARKTEADIAKEIELTELVEICYDQEP